MRYRRCRYAVDGHGGGLVHVYANDQTVFAIVSRLCDMDRKDCRVSQAQQDRIWRVYQDWEARCKNAGNAFQSQRGWESMSLAQFALLVQALLANTACWQIPTAFNGRADSIYHQRVYASNLIRSLYKDKYPELADLERQQSCKDDDALQTVFTEFTPSTNASALGAAAATHHHTEVAANST